MKIAYLSSEIPSTSATFVYREILEVERQGHCVTPFTLRHAKHLAVEPSARELGERVTAIYERPLAALCCIVAQVLFHPIRTARSFSYFLSDAATLAPSGWAKLCFKFLGGLVLARRMGNAGCQQLHVHFAHAPATVGMYGALAAGIPFSVTAHANDLYENAELLAQKIARAKPFITISEFNRKHLRRTFPEARIELVRCGIGVEALAPGFIPAEVKAGEALNVVALGRLVPKKGFYVLLRALALLEESGTAWRCTLAGDGPENERLKSLAVELKLPTERLVFAGGLAPSAVAELLKSAHVFALPCVRDKNGDVDGIPVVLMEAMALGIPCVSTRISGIPELISNCNTGLLVPPEDVGALAQTLRAVLESPAEVREMALRGREYVWHEFSRERNAACLTGLWAGVRDSNRDCTSKLPDSNIQREE